MPTTTRLVVASVVGVWFVSFSYCLFHWSTTIGPIFHMISYALRMWS